MVLPLSYCGYSDSWLVWMSASAAPWLFKAAITALALVALAERASPAWAAVVCTPTVMVTTSGAPDTWPTPWAVTPVGAVVNDGSGDGAAAGVAGLAPDVPQPASASNK